MTHVCRGRETVVKREVLRTCACGAYGARRCLAHATSLKPYRLSFYTVTVRVTGGSARDKYMT